MHLGSGPGAIEDGHVAAHRVFHVEGGEGLPGRLHLGGDGVAITRLPHILEEEGRGVSGLIVATVPP